MGNQTKINTEGGDYREIHNRGQYAEGNFYINCNFYQNPSKSHEFIKNNLEKISYKERPIQFVKVLFFIIGIFCFWLFIWWRVEYKLPLRTAWDLFMSLFKGNINEKIADLQFENDSAFNNFVNNNSAYSLEEKIALEAKINFCLDLIQDLVSEKANKKEALASFLSKNNLKLVWFSEKIKPEKEEKYSRLCTIQNQRRNKLEIHGTIIKKYLDNLNYFLSMSESSDDLIYELIDRTDDFIASQIKPASIQDLTALKGFRNFLCLVSEKFITDLWSDETNLQRRYNNLREEIENLSESYSQQQNEYAVAQKKILDLTQNFKNIEEGYKNRIGILSQENEKNSRERDALLSIQKQIKENPFSYLIDASGIQFISKGKNKYHYHPRCNDWKSLVFDYMYAKSFNLTNISEFRVSKFKSDFQDKEECTICSKLSNLT